MPLQAHLALHMKRVHMRGSWPQGVAGAGRCGWDAAGARKRVQPVGHLRPAGGQPVSLQRGPAHSQGEPHRSGVRCQAAAQCKQAATVYNGACLSAHPDVVAGAGKVR